MGALARLATGLAGPDDRPDAGRLAAADRALRRLRRLHSGAAAVGAHPPWRCDRPRGSRRDRPRGALVPLLARRAGRRRDVVLQREPRPAVPHRLLSRRRPVPRRRLRPQRANRPRAARRRARAPDPLARSFRSVEMAEWNSAPYFPIDLKGLCALHAPLRRARDRRPRRGRDPAAAADHRPCLPPGPARSLAGSQLRAHPARGAHPGTRRHHPMLWGRGWYGRQVQALPLLALDIRDHGLVPADGLAELALWNRPTHLEWAYVQGEGGFAPLYHYKGRHFAIGSLAAYRPGLWGYQETVLHARIGEHPDAQIWINHPGERSDQRLRAAVLLGRLRDVAAPASLPGAGDRRLRHRSRDAGLHPRLFAARHLRRGDRREPSRAGPLGRRAGPAAGERRRSSPLRAGLRPGWSSGLLADTPAGSSASRTWAARARCRRSASA